MSVKLRLIDVQLGQLNNQCLMLVVRFVRALKAHNGTALRVQEPDILMQISKHSRNTKDSELRKMYKELKAEILICVQEGMNKNRA